MSIRTIAAVLLCLSGLVYFLARGPYREVGSLNSYDFAAVYGAAQCWLNGQNPYDMAQVRSTLVAAGNNSSRAVFRSAARGLFADRFAGDRVSRVASLGAGPADLVLSVRVGVCMLPFTDFQERRIVD